MNNVLAPQVRPQVLTVLWLAERLWGWLLFCPIFGLDQCYVVSLEHNSLKRLPGVSLQVDLHRLVQHQVHVLVEPCDNALNPCIDVLVKPHRNNSSVLEISEDEVDGLNHNLLNLLSTSVTHLSDLL